MSGLSLRRIVLYSSNQDVSRCQACYDCDVDTSNEQDIPLGSMIQLVAYNDEEVLTCQTLWSEKVYEAARTACKRGLNVQKIMLALRDESRKRGLT